MSTPLTFCRYQFKDLQKSCFFEVVIQSGELNDMPRQKLGGLKPTFEFGPNWKRWQTLLEMAHLMRGQGKSGSGALVWDVLVYVPKKLGAEDILEKMRHLEKALQASLEATAAAAAAAAAGGASSDTAAAASASGSGSGGKPGHCEGGSPSTPKTTKSELL
jgi:hypothetical protein